MSIGGNSRLEKFFKKYQLDKKFPSKSHRYKTKAGRYYRDLLKSEIKNIEAPPPP